MLPFQGDNKKMEDAKFYLTLPGTKAEMEEKELQASKTQANFAPTKESTKDSFQIATLICSTKLTQNGRCGAAVIPSALCLCLLGPPDRLWLHHMGHVFGRGCWALGLILFSSGDGQGREVLAR